MRAEKPDDDVIGTWWRNANGTAVALALANASEMQKTINLRLPKGIGLLRPRTLKGHVPCTAVQDDAFITITVPACTFALLETVQAKK